MKKFLSIFLVFTLISIQSGMLPLSANAKIFSRISKDKISPDIKYSYINIDWWKNFNDEQLIEYINDSVENNYDLKMMANATEEYYQAVKLQRSQELPQAGAGFAPIGYKLPLSNKYDWHFFLPVAVNYEADIFLKNHDKTKSAKKTYEMSLLEEKSAYISVVSGVGTIYFNIVKLNNVIDIQKEIVQNRKQIYLLTKKQNEKGLISQSDTILAEKSYTQSFIELSDLQKEREKLLHELSVILGQSPETSQNLKITDYKNINFTGKMPDTVSSDIIYERPDYKEAEKMVEKAGIDVRIARKEFLPSFDIAGLALFNASDFGSIFTTMNSLLALGGGIFQPLFLGGARVANLKMKKAGYERVLNNYKKTNLAALQEINDSLYTIKKDEDKLEQIKLQQQLSEQEYFYNSKKYQKGLISYLDLIRSKENMLQMNKVVIIQQMDNYVNYIGLYKACGAKI